MKHLLIPTCATASLVFAAPQTGAEEIRKDTEFAEAVVGKKLVNGEGWLLIAQDGTLTGEGWKQEPINGTWVWDARYFCRTIVIGIIALPKDCQKVTVDGDIVMFTGEKGKGGSVSLRVDK